MELVYDTNEKTDIFYRVLNNLQKNKENKSVKAIEQLVVQIVREIMHNGNAQFTLANNNNWNNIVLDDEQTLVITKNHKADNRHVILKHKTSIHRFCLIVYALQTAHRVLLLESYTSIRELYYRDTEFAVSQSHVEKAVHDLTCILQITPWQLNILTSGKGLMAGPLRVLLKNAEIVDCSSYNGANLIPNDFNAVEDLHTTADFVLLVEKETVFEHLLASKLFKTGRVILVTGKGYPDLGTRILVQRLSNECNLPIYAIFDANPYGIEIMLTYRHGSKAMSGTVHNVSCPKLKWLGVHPCEMKLMPRIKRMPMTRRDKAKLQQLLSRPYLSTVIRMELETMNELQTKCEIEGLHNVSDNFFCDDYIVNKIKRKLFL